MAAKVRLRPKTKIFHGLQDGEIELLLADLPERDGKPMDSDWHRLAMVLIIDVLRCLFQPRTDFYVSGNIFIYYCLNQIRQKKFLGPDAFFVWNVRDGDRLRPFWRVWEEDGKYPNVIWELLSSSTKKRDRTTKKEIYEQTFRTLEYFLYDPDNKQLEGWRLVDGRYQEIQPDERGWLWSEQLQLWVGLWVGSFQSLRATWVRFYDDKGQLCPTFAEAAEAKTVQATQRADEAERELARVKKHLTSSEKTKNGK